MEGRDIAKTLIWVVGILISYLGYFLRISPVIEELYGIYFRGLLDGGVATIILMATIFYMSSFFKTSKPAQDTGKTRPQPTRSTQKKARTPKVEPKFVQEIITRLRNVERIFNQIVERAGGFDTFHILRVRIEQDEETEFRQNIDWLAENYPQIAAETSKAMRHAYVDQIRGIRVNDYDPILQIIQHNSIRSIVERGGFFIREFNENMKAGRARLLAYSGYLKKKN